MDLDSSGQRKTILIKTPAAFTDASNRFAAFFTDLNKTIKDLPGQRVVSFELKLQDNYFTFLCNAASAVIPTLAALAYSHFQDLEIQDYEESEIKSEQNPVLLELRLERSNYFPLKTRLDPAQDPFVTLAALVSQLDQSEEGLHYQVVIEPYSEPWLRQLIRENLFGLLGWLNSWKIFFEKPFLEKEPINYYDTVKSKFGPKLFRASLRVLAYSPDSQRLEANLSLFKKALSKLDNGDINALKAHTLPQSQIKEFWSRALTSSPLILNAEEVAALYHFPDQSLAIGNVDHLHTTRLEPPVHLPKAGWLAHPDISSFGVTNFRDARVPFGIKREDRNRHLYLIGKTGMGKTKLMELLAIADMQAGKGLCVIDPHGDLAVELLRYVPSHRLHDVIYFNPADKDYPIGFNPLACITPEAKYQVVTGFIGIFQKLFAATWTSRLEHMLRFIVLALVEVGGTTVLDIVRLLTEVEFRQQVIAKLQDPVVKNFWMHEFAAWNEKFDKEAIIPILNQVGQFLANDYIRGVVGQVDSAIDFYKAMQTHQIVIVNLAKGKLGEENTALLGSMLITKIQEATMARVSLPEVERTDFYLYVDEFQHFATEAFNQILSEARKFNLSLTIAHQYLGQLTESIRKTVFGNVGSFISFRVGPEDVEFLTTEFRPRLSPDDFINLDARTMYVKLAIASKTSTPFSAVSLDLPPSPFDNSETVIQFSRQQYGTMSNKRYHHEKGEEYTGGEAVVFEEPLV